MARSANINGPRIFAKASRKVVWPAVKMTAPKWHSGQKAINGPEIKEINFPAECKTSFVIDIF